MRKRLTNILTTLTLVLTLSALTAACSAGSDTGGGGTPQAPEVTTTLIIRADKVGSLSRTGRAEDTMERLNQLRIIIVSADGTIEVNRTVDLTPIDDMKDFYAIYRLKPAQTKRIYAIGNPASCGFSFDTYAEGSKASFEDDIKNYVFTFDAKKPITMIDNREVPAEKLIAGKRTNVEMQLVRVGTKFMVNIVNNRDEDVNLTGFKINGLGAKQYLMPHFTGEKGETTNGLHVISENGVSGFNFTTNPTNGLASSTNTDMHWTDWMALAVEESQKAPGDKTLADRRGWIMKYSVPADAGTVTGDYQVSETYAATEVAIPKGKNIALNAQYFAETRNGVIANSTFGNGDAAGFEQSYTFNVSFTSGETVGGEKKFENLKFPNLRALFRNTNVLVNIYLWQEKVTCTVNLVPYANIELRPGFGWDELPDSDENPDPDLQK